MHCLIPLQVLKEPIEVGLGRWVLDQYNLYDQQHGVVRGVNNDLLLVVKHLQEMKDVTLEVILPSLYHLQVRG